MKYGVLFSVPDALNFKKIVAFFKVPLQYLYGDTNSRVKENQVLSDCLHGENSVHLHPDDEIQTEARYEIR